MWRKIKTWFVVLSTSVCIFNVLGFDDKNILLLLINPLYWIFGGFRMNSTIILHYIVIISFWFLFGALLDTLFSRKPREKLLRKRF